MKKILSIILGAFICLQSFAQVSVNAGYLNSSYKYSDGGYSLKVNGNGFYAGVGFDIKSSNYPQFSFAPGLNFNLVDYNVGDGVNAVEYFASAPLHLKLTQPMSNVADLYVSAGPTLICTLGSNSRYSYGSVSYTENEKGGDFDVALGLEGGLLLSNNIKLMVGYDFGTINQNDDNDYKVTRNILHVGVGYIF